MAGIARRRRSCACSCSAHLVGAVASVLQRVPDGPIGQVEAILDGGRIEVLASGSELVRQSATEEAVRASTTPGSQRSTSLSQSVSQRGVSMRAAGGAAYLERVGAQ